MTTKNRLPLEIRPTTLALSTFPVGVVPSNSLYRDDFSAPEPMAVRADARILRVLLAAYEDEAQSLNMPGYALCRGRA